MRSMMIHAPTDMPPNESEGAILMERGEKEHEPIGYRRGYQGTTGKEQDDTASAG